MITATLLAIAFQVPAPAADPFAPMAFLVGHCWQADMGQNRVDTHCFESLYGGRFIRDRHEVTGGPARYEGETIYTWNAATNRVEYSYWASNGGVSRGALRARDGSLDFGEDVHRRANGSELRINTIWRPGDASYDVVWTSSEAAMNRTMRYSRVDRAAVKVDSVARPDGTTDLIHEVVVAAPVTEVYRNMSTAEGWRSWSAPNAWEVPGEPDLIETSYSPENRQGDPRNIRQRMLVRVPDRLIVFRTVQAPPRFPHAEEFFKVTQVIELSPVGDRATRVRLTGIGYPASEGGRVLVGFFREGNRTVMEKLQQSFAAPAATASR